MNGKRHLGELRAARRISVVPRCCPLIADCERGLGRPDRAFAIARGDDARDLSGEERLEMLIVEAGARHSTSGGRQSGWSHRNGPTLHRVRSLEATRLYYAYAEALAGRRS